MCKSIHSDNYSDWKEKIKGRVKNCNYGSDLYEEYVLDKVIQIAQCLRKIKNSVVWNEEVYSA